MMTSKKQSNPAPKLNNFETFYQSICSNLKQSGEVQTVSETFSRAASDEERMRFVIKKDFTSSLQFDRVNFLKKNKEESNRFRALGNQEYKKNKVKEALEFYNQSILFAPQQMKSDFFEPGFQKQQVKEKVCIKRMPESQFEDPKTLEELALGYANRSAVLFQLKEYELCIDDISRAIDNGYPDSLKYKLYERKARCFKEMNEFSQSLEAMKKSETWVRHSSLSETQSSTFEKEISGQITLLEKKISAMNICEFRNATDEGKNLKTDKTPLPTMSQESNKEVPCLRGDLKLEYSENKGRYLVAVQDIPAGESIIIETPYTSVLLSDYFSTHCQFCFARPKAPIPCCCCARVRFCSFECRDKAWDRFHKIECSQLDLITDPSIGKMGMLALRILSSSGKIYLDTMLLKIREEREARMAKSQESSEAERSVGFNEEHVYDSADYRTIYGLVSNTTQRDPSDLFKRSMMAAYLLKILERTPFFSNESSESFNISEEERVAKGAVLLNHLQNLPCNAHEVSEMELPSSLDESSCRDAFVHEIGAAVYGTLSLINHSCDPNVVRHYYSSSAVVRTIRPIKKGEEILDNYGYHYAVMEKEDRQKILSGQYFFVCQCSACLDNWPTYPSIPTSLEVLPGCDEKATVRKHQMLSKNYKKAFDDVLQGRYGGGLTIFIEYLNFLDQNFQRPVRDYNECQEAIKQCFSAMANVYIPVMHKK